MKHLFLFLTILPLIAYGQVHTYTVELPKEDAVAQTTLAERLQNLSVTVKADLGSGSGVLVTRGGINYVMTAAHVVDGNRSIDTLVNNSTGEKIRRVKFSPVTIMREIFQDGRSVGQMTVEADVIAYSSADYGQDLALLKLRHNITTDSATFWLPGATLYPPTGTKIAHVGSFLGESGANSFSEGRISQTGRLYKDKVYDQTDVMAFPGSSGGGIFLQDTGEYIGTLTRGAGQGYILYVPMRRVIEWAKDHNAEFIFNPEVAGDASGVVLETLEPDGDSGSGRRYSNDLHTYIYQPQEQK